MQELKLTPLIEIAYCNQGIGPPGLHPRAEHLSEWEEYRSATHQKAGFEQPMTPFREGLFLFRFDSISEFNLEKLVRDHVDSAMQYGEEPVPLTGGFALEANESVLLSPQCCGDLSDISFWRAISQGHHDVSWEAHPSPDVTYKDGRAYFSCIDEYDAFKNPYMESFDISLIDLAAAVESADAQLKEFEARLKLLLSRLHLPPFENRLTFARSAQ